MYICTIIGNPVQYFNPQYLVLCIVSGLASLSIGTVLGFSAILLPQLEDEGQLGKNSSESSWIGKEKKETFLFRSLQ